MAEPASPASPGSGGRLLLLESSDIGASYAAEAARRLGLEPLYLCQIGSYQGDSRSRLEREPHLEADTCDVGSMRAALERAGVREGEVAAVSTFVDARLRHAVALSRALGVSGLDPQIEHLKDKSHVAELVPEGAPETWHFHAESPPLPALAEALSRAGRLIVKPTHGAGGAGIVHLSSRGELDRLPRTLASLSLPSSLDSGRFVAQRFVHGPMVSAEGWVEAGRVRLLGFTSRRKIAETETGAGFPADDELPESARAEAALTLQRLADRSGLERGWFHVEFVVEAGRALLIDANVGRLGGGPMGELISLSYGLEPACVYEHALRVGLYGASEHDPFASCPARERTYAILYGLPRASTVLSVSLPPLGRCRHTQLVDPGSPVAEIGRDDWSWVGILSGPEREVVGVFERVRVATPEGLLSPVY